VLEVEALREYLRLAGLRYDDGYASYLEVLYAENRLYGSELTHTQTQGALFQALVNVYKAMGGGWVVTAEGRTKEIAQGAAAETQTPPGK
jgi:multidrug efflux system outer membrane protein